MRHRRKKTLIKRNRYKFKDDYIDRSFNFTNIRLYTLIYTSLYIFVAIWAQHVRFLSFCLCSSVYYKRA